MKILIISPNTKLFPDPVYPIGAAYIAIICKQNGYTVEAFDCNFKENIEKSLSEKINTFSPDVIGISVRNVDNVTLARSISYLPEYEKIINTCRKNSDSILILGGSGFSLFPEKFFKFLKPDFGVVGSGEESVITLLENIRSGKQTEKIVYTKEMDFHDSKVIPDRSFFNFKKYYKIGGLLSVQSQRGCTFKCSYCAYPYLEGYKVTTRDVEIFIDEIEYLKEKYNARYFFIVDSVFNHAEAHVFDVCNEIVKRNLKIKWSAYIRPKMKDPAIFEAMKEAGCKSIELGTDSLAEPILKSLNKSFTVDDVFKFCEKCRDAKIAFCHSLIFGAPGETEETVKTTVKNIRATNSTAILAFVGIRILPNTPLADYCVETGYIKSYDEIGLDPVFYVGENIDEKWIFSYLREVVKKDSRWIVPGVTTPKILTQKLMRFVNKRGLLWEFKKYVTIGQRLSTYIFE